MQPEDFHTEAESEETVRYGHVYAWAKELGISTNAVRARIKDLDGIVGVPRRGPPAIAYAEDDVRKACADLLEGVWDRNFECFKIWMKENSNKLPSTRHRNLEERKLEYWIRNQKSTWINGKLPEDKKMKLEEYGVIFRSREDEWNKSLEDLKRFMTEKNREPSGKSTDDEERCLGVWLYGQRAKKRKGKLDSEKERILKKLGITWDVRQKSWKDNFEKLSSFISKTNQWPKSNSEEEEEAALGRWVITQRKNYRNGTLDQESIDQLNKIQIAWSIYDAQWKEGLEYLKVTLQQNDGKIPCQDFKNDEERKAHNWLGVQRKKYKRGELDDEQVLVLQGMNVELDPFAVKWINNYESLREFIQTNDRKPKNHSEDEYENKLAQWIANQKANWRNGTLDEDRIKKLQEIDIAL